MTGGLRSFCWALAGVGAVVAAGLLAWVLVADLEGPSQVAGVVSAVTGAAALVLGVRQLKSAGRTPRTPPPSE
ncbi:hypothetical protein [Streptomyces sp. NPDC051561]|uniref:hypothetical protein n=1 Tax=Streptomyces sp. NPDC051561 TaxID=3365658 RepID=UPI0037977ABB